MFQFAKKNPAAFFLLKALLLYIFWYLFYELWLHPIGYLDAFVIDNLYMRYRKGSSKTVLLIFFDCPFDLF